jgi:hypothetical protein
LPGTAPRTVSATGSGLRPACIRELTAEGKETYRGHPLGLREGIHTGTVELLRFFTLEEIEAIRAWIIHDETPKDFTDRMEAVCANVLLYRWRDPDLFAS